MSMRSQQQQHILDIQVTIDHYSYLWVTTHNIHAYAQYTYWVHELEAVKQAILAHEQVYGWNN